MADTDEFRREVVQRFERHSNGIFPGSPIQAIDVAVEVFAEHTAAPSRPPVAPSVAGWPKVPDLPLGERATAALDDDARPPVADTEWGVGNPIVSYVSEEEARAVYGRCVSTGQRVRLVRRAVGEWIEVESTHG